jgi:HKD family nuclease
VIIIQDQTLARAYTIEFNEMWGSTGLLPDTSASKFGSFKTDNTPHDFIVGGKKVECYFSPSDNVNTQILNTIAEADSNAYFATMLITRNDIAQSLVDFDVTGAEVKGIIDAISSTTQYSLLSSQLTPSELFVNPDTTIIMHHKYLITDHNENASDPQLWVGSHNWSTNANTRNDENSLVIHDANLVNQYYQEFTSRISAPPITGCINASACNFNPAATIADSSCLFIASACDDLNPNTINDVVNFSCACVGQQISMGCTDVSACNFSSSANTDDGSCVFINDPCDDGNPLTQNDSIAANCSCEGIVSHIQETNSSSLAIFPNPCNDLASIQWFSQTGGPAVIRVYDAIGKTQESYQITASSGLNLQQVNVQRFAKGRYELVISNGAQVLRSVLIIE